jgi:hypothetical protein
MPHKRHYVLWAIAIAVFAIAAGALGGAAWALQPEATTCKPPSCQIPPPRGDPLPAQAQYTSPRFGFSLQYPSDEAPSKQNDSGVAWVSRDNSEGASIKGMDANGLGPQQIVQNEQQSHYSNATAAYPPSGIPGADLGYMPGYGQVYDVYVSGGQSQHIRVVIIAAVMNGTGIVLEAEAPFQQTSENNDGHPNPAQLNIVHFPFFHMASSTLTWRGEPPL